MAREASETHAPVKTNADKGQDDEHGSRDRKVSV
jgi:hypothetical protein